jgi:hypothetical protein
MTRVAYCEEIVDAKSHPALAFRGCATWLEQGHQTTMRVLDVLMLGRLRILLSLCEPLSLIHRASIGSPWKALLMQTRTTRLAETLFIVRSIKTIALEQSRLCTSFLVCNGLILTLSEASFF